ncbi:hypothetical protein BDZ97DRAFT_1774525 [Flammula alnicola]|nr:hypothetical protein BDZ97DRAFT_1774525 [Flammula alnicola]
MMLAAFSRYLRSVLSDPLVLFQLGWSIHRDECDCHRIWYVYARFQPYAAWTQLLHGPTKTRGSFDAINLLRSHLHFCSIQSVKCQSTGEEERQTYSVRSGSGPVIGRALTA